MFSFQWKHNRLYTGQVLPPANWWSLIDLIKRGVGSDLLSPNLSDVFILWTSSKEPFVPTFWSFFHFSTLRLRFLFLALDIEKNDDGFPLSLSLSCFLCRPLFSLSPSLSLTHTHSHSLSCLRWKSFQILLRFFAQFFCGRFYSCAPAEDLSIFLPLSEKTFEIFPEKYFCGLLKK